MLAIAGAPDILLPYPFATANHQWHNAQAFGRDGAAIVVDDRAESGRTNGALVSAAAPLLRLPELRREMRLAMLALARLDAARGVVDEILSLAAACALNRQSA